MPLNLASPGIVVREIDLTIGRATPSSNKIGGIVAPFAKGPVNSPTLVENENDLLSNFGEPYATDKHYEHWLVASSYLSYGGSLSVVRADDDMLKNAFIGTASSVKIKSLEHYEELGYDENTLDDVLIAARNPGTWANGITVAIIDGKSDQIISGIDTSAFEIGYGVTQSTAGKVNAGIGTTSVLDEGYIKGIVTGIGVSSIEVKILSYVDGTGYEENRDYTQFGIWSFTNSGILGIHTVGGYIGTESYTARKDWFDQQKVGLTSTSYIMWNNIAPRPETSGFAAARNSRFDEIHVVVIDSLGKVTGNSGSILEKHLNLSKASDAEYSAGSTAYWRKFIASNSKFILALGSPQESEIVPTGFAPNTYEPLEDNGWNQAAANITFGASGASNNVLQLGTNYGGSTDYATPGSFQVDISGLVEGYDIFEAADIYNVDFLLMGSAGYDKEDAQALANKIISVAELRKDAIAFISPYRGAALTDTENQTEVTLKSPTDITENIISFYSAITSSSYGVFDSGYKYVYDRFGNTFRYVPLNGDLAGLCARNDINNFPWYSPAGTNRGAILNAIKLSFNPTKTQRDKLYTNRVNPIIFSPGAGIVLFGDKTGYAKASAFDRINVRRLFIYLEKAISQAAKDQLFEFNDEITRTNFVNTIEPFLRDVQAKRGIFDYIVICDETNNTPAVIDNNEFIADIYIKPTRSINFIGLNFIATKTGVDFEEVIGNF